MNPNGAGGGPSSPSTPPRRALKCALIGASGVGKTSLRQRAFARSFSQTYKATLGADYLTKTFSFPGEEPVSFAAWDTAGQERFRSLASAFYRGSDACILVYNSTSPTSETIDSLKSWFNEFVARCPISDEAITDFPFIVVGNKVDLLSGSEEGGGSSVIHGGDGEEPNEEIQKVLRELVPIKIKNKKEVKKKELQNGYKVDGDPPINCRPTGNQLLSTQPPLDISIPKPSSTPAKIDIVPPNPPHLPPSHLSTLRQQKHSSTDPSELQIGTMRTNRSSVNTTQTIYHTPSSSFNDYASSTLGRRSGGGRGGEEGESSAGTSYKSEGTIRAETDADLEEVGTTSIIVQPDSEISSTPTEEEDQDQIEEDDGVEEEGGSDEEVGRGEDDREGGGGDYFGTEEEFSRTERERESANGVDVFMTSSPPHLPLNGFPTINSKLNYRNPNERLLHLPSKTPPPPSTNFGASTTNSTSKKPTRSSSLAARELAESQVLAEERRLSFLEELEKYDQDGIKHFYTSAKTGEGVDEVFEYVVKRVLVKWKKEELEDREFGAGGSTIKVGEEEEGKKSWKEVCCLIEG